LEKSSETNRLAKLLRSDGHPFKDFKSKLKLSPTQTTHYKYALPNNVARRQLAVLRANDTPAKFRQELKLKTSTLILRLGNPKRREKSGGIHVAETHFWLIANGFHNGRAVIFQNGLAIKNHRFFMVPRPGN
jgi:hypothetical protein